MKNKIKLIDRLKSWLVTLGIASVFGLAALGVNAANSYQKTSAYDIYNNDVRLFAGNNFDYSALYSLVKNNGYSILDSDYNAFDLQLVSHDFAGSSEDLVGTTLLTNYVVIELADLTHLYFTYSLESFGNDAQTFSLVYDEADEYWIWDEAMWANVVQDGFEGSVCAYGSIGYQSLRNYLLSYNVPQESGNFVTALTSFMSLIGGGIVQLAQTIGAGVVSFASGLFLDSGHLSILGGIIGIFAGIALAVGITSKVYSWVSTLGN